MRSSTPSPRSDILNRHIAHAAVRALLTAAVLLSVPAGPPLDAQFLPFGRNKISYADFDWHILRTDHFDIYYYPEMELLAQRGAAFAEESFGKLEREFNFTILHRIPLIFYSTPIHFQQTNVTPGFIPDGVGGFFEFLKGRVVIPAAGSMEQFRHVINHELVHVFMHNRLEQVLSDHGQPNEKYPPLWYVEGLAEFYSTTWDSQAEMLLRDAVLSGYFTPVSGMYAISGSFLMYKEGQSALEFMAREYGRESVLGLVDNIWRSADFEDVMRATIGRSYEEFDRAWLRDLRKRYFPLLATKERPSDISAAIVAEGFNSKPVFYRRGDSASVIFIGNHDGYTSIYRASLAAGEPRMIVQGEKSDDLEAFHPFQSRMSLNRDGVLAFVTKSGERDALHLLDIESECITRSLSFPGLIMLGSPSWAPDGRRIVFSAIDKGGQSDLFTVDTGTEELVRLTADVYDDRDPAWSPDGATIAFCSDRGARGVRGVYGLFAFDFSSARISHLAGGEAGYASPSWSPDGTYLAFTSDRDSTHNLYVMRPAGSPSPRAGIRRVTNFVTAAFDPVWTDKGSLIFTAFDGYRFQIRALRGVAERFDSLEAVDVPRSEPGVPPWTPLALRGTTGSEPFRYEKEFQLDIAQSQITTDPVFGTIGGAALSLSDLLGNDRYYFLIYNTAQTSSEFLSSFSVAISRISIGQRTPYAYGIFNFSGRRYDFLDPDEYFIERAFGGYFAASYPLSLFRRFEGAVSLSNSDKESIDDDRKRKALLLTNSISYVKDNALYFYTGPIDGSRFNLTLSYTTDIRFSNVNYYSVMTDYRRYFRLGMHSCVAMRAELLYNHGKEARRYFLGGSWDLRGWPRWSIRGTKRWLTSVELRFPVLDRVGFDFPFGSIDIGLLRGAIFADAGNSWDDVYGETLGSIGAGLRFSLLGILVLRYDFGKRIERNFTKFQADMFHQFFFGWDF